MKKGQRSTTQEPRGFRACSGRLVVWFGGRLFQGTSRFTCQLSTRKLASQSLTSRKTLWEFPKIGDPYIVP